MMYDVTSSSSFSELHDIYNAFTNELSQRTLIIVANKIDLVTETSVQREVSFEEGLAFS